MSAEMKVSVLVKGRALLGRGFRIGRGPDSRLYQNAKSSLGAEKDRPVVGQGEWTQVSETIGLTLPASCFRPVVVASV